MWSVGWQEARLAIAYLHCSGSPLEPALPVPFQTGSGPLWGSKDFGKATWSRSQRPWCPFLRGCWDGRVFFVEKGSTKIRLGITITVTSLACTVCSLICKFEPWCQVHLTANWIPFTMPPSTDLLCWLQSQTRGYIADEGNFTPINNCLHALQKQEKWNWLWKKTWLDSTNIAPFLGGTVPLPLCLWHSAQRVATWRLSRSEAAVAKPRVKNKDDGEFRVSMICDCLQVVMIWCMI